MANAQAEFGSSGFPFDFDQEIFEAITALDQLGTIRGDVNLGLELGRLVLVSDYVEPGIGRGESQQLEEVVRVPDRSVIDLDNLVSNLELSPSLIMWSREK